jgi:hypothetical protein
MSGGYVTRLNHNNIARLKSSKYRDLHLLLFWFAPILVTVSTGRLAVFNLDHIVVYLLFLFVLLGGIYVLTCLHSSKLSINVLIVIFTLFGSVLYSDFTEIRFVVALVAYSVVVHAISKRFPLAIWRQYYLICIILSWMTIIEILSYFLIGEFLFSFRSPGTGSDIFPRVSPIFDEMSHQSFFIMPAAIVAYKQNIKHFILLSIGVLFTLSVAATVLFIPLLIYFNMEHIRLNLVSILTVIFTLVVFLLSIFVSYDLIASKIGFIAHPEALYTFTKPISAVNILIGIDFLKNFSVNDWLFGFGYFNDGDELKMLLSNSLFYNYYYNIGIFNNEMSPSSSSIGIVNLVTSFGTVILFFTAYLLFKAKKYATDKKLYKLAIFIVIASMLKNSHTIDYLVHLFFIFGLTWCSTSELLLNKNK